VTAWCGRLGIETRFEGGLRVTDAATLEVAAAVLAGLANKRLVAALRVLGVDAVGLAALDGGTIVAAPHARAATLGAVGEVRAVDASLLHTLLAQGRTPVVASIASDADGRLLNLNADDAAAALAVAVGADDLVLLSDAPGVVIDGAIVPRLPLADLDATLARPDVTGGMLPKLRAAGEAARGGVARVHIGAWNGPGTLAAILGGGAAGTTLVASAGRQLTATEDVHA